jgi:hypothetical protein
MTIGADIKDVLSEVGAAYTIIRDSGNISGEYGVYDLTSQATKPVTLEHFRRGMLSYDTQVVEGDVIEFDTTSERYMVMNKLPELFENTVVQYESIFYKCNVLEGKLLRPSGEDVDSNTYHSEIQWEVVKDNCNAMQVAALYGNDLVEEEKFGLIGLRKDEVYLPSSVGAKVLDRFQPVSGEYYMVATIETRRFPGVDVLIVEEDHR